MGIVMREVLKNACYLACARQQCDASAHPVRWSVVVPHCYAAHALCDAQNMSIPSGAKIDLFEVGRLATRREIIGR